MAVHLWVVLIAMQHLVTPFTLVTLSHGQSIDIYSLTINCMTEGHLIYSAQYYTLIASMCQPLATQFARFVGHDASGFDVSFSLMCSRSLGQQSLILASFTHLVKIVGGQFTPITSEGACYAKCAAININPKTAGNVSIVEFNVPAQYCMCKTTANLAYTNFVVSTGWNANLVGNCAMYPQSR